MSSQPDARFLGHVHASFLAVFDQFALDLRAWHSKMWKGLQTAMFDISWPPEHSCLLVFGKLPGLTEIDLVHLAIVRNDPSRKLLRRIFNGVHLVFFASSFDIGSCCRRKYALTSASLRGCTSVRNPLSIFACTRCLPSSSHHEHPPC